MNEIILYTNEKEIKYLVRELLKYSKEAKELYKMKDIKRKKFTIPIDTKDSVFLHHNTIVVKACKNINLINIELNHEFSEPKEANGFILKVTDFGIDNLKEILSRDSVHYPGLKIGDVVERVSSIRHYLSLNIAGRVKGLSIKDLTAISFIIQQDKDKIQKVLLDLRYNKISVARRLLEQTSS